MVMGRRLKLDDAIDRSAMTGNGCWLIEEWEHQGWDTWTLVVSDLSPLCRVILRNVRGGQATTVDIWLLDEDLPPRLMASQEFDPVGIAEGKAMAERAARLAIKAMASIMENADATE